MVLYKQKLTIIALLASQVHAHGVLDRVVPEPGPGYAQTVGGRFAPQSVRSNAMMFATN